MKETTTRYVQSFTVPKKIPADSVLVHNHVKHTARTRSSVRGFRAWTQKLSDRLEPCKCGWSGLPHYRVTGLLHYPIKARHSSPDVTFRNTNE